MTRFHLQRHISLALHGAQSAEKPEPLGKGLHTKYLKFVTNVGAEMVLELMMLVIVLRAQLVTEQSQQRRQRLPRWWQEGCAHATSAANEDHPQ